MKLGAHVPLWLASRVGGSAISGIHDTMRTLDESAFCCATTGDTVQNHAELYTAMGAMAALTERITVAPLTTQLVTRRTEHVLAHTLSMGLLAQGRYRLVLSRGDSSVLQLGEKPQTVSSFWKTFDQLRELLHEAWGNLQRRRVVETGPPGMYVVGEGPKMIRIAAAKADGLYSGVGLDHASVTLVTRWIEEGLAQRPHSLGKLDHWRVARASIALDDDEAEVQLGRGLASMVAHSLGTAPEKKGIPEALMPAMREYCASYSYEDKAGHDGQDGNIDRLKSLGLYQYARDRYAVTGSIVSTTARISELRSRGISQLHVAVRSAGEVELWEEALVRSGQE